MGKFWELYLYVVCRLPMSVLPSKHPQLLKNKKRVPIMISTTTAIKIFWEPTSPLTTTAPAKATGWGIAGIASHLKDFIQNSETSSPPKDRVFNHTIPYHTIFVIFGTQPRHLSPGLHKSLDVLQSYPESCCTIAFAVIFQPSPLYYSGFNHLIDKSSLWVINIVFWIINRVF